MRAITDSNTESQYEYQLKSIIENRFLKSPDAASSDEINYAIGSAVTDNYASDRIHAQTPESGKKRAYYLSAEFLMGRAIFNNLMSLGIYEKTDEILHGTGGSLAKLKDIEDAGLGNGGLGRLAACFMDSAATLSLPVMGYGIRYKYGIFKQKIEDGEQREYPDDWTEKGDAWSICRADESVDIEFDDFKVRAVPYDMPVYGYKNNYAVTVRLWEARPFVPFDFELFNKQKYSDSLEEKNQIENISRVLYPADDLEEGKKLRLRQQYFFSTASLKDVIRLYKKIHGSDFNHFADENIFQLNDTHPVISIPSFICLLCEDEHVPFNEALSIAKKCFAYTNHTIMSEALEKWDEQLVKGILGKVYAYIAKLDDCLREELSSADLSTDEIDSMKIISDGKINMANMALYICKNVNGVAKIHTDIIKRDLFSSWNRLYPGKIINITNGITQRRWLGVANPELASFVTKLTGSGEWKYDLTKLSTVRQYAKDPEIIEEFNNIKKYRRRVLADYIREKENCEIDPDSVFDIQIKRLHEYKRQLLNALSALQMYFDIKDGIIKNPMPVTLLIGGKAAPGYRRAKNIIKLICSIEKLIKSDSSASKYLNLHFIEGYNVSYAELLVGAADISEQISTAGTEASGTGNMKMMLNGALTLGTLDGANIEIVSEAGRENNYIFGATVEEIESIRSSYNPVSLYEKDDRIKRLLNFIKEDLDYDNSDAFADIYDSLLIESNADRYFLLYDFDSYYKTKTRAIGDFKDRTRTGIKALENIAAAGIFSSDRSVKNYADKIWQIKPDNLTEGQKNLF